MESPAVAGHRMEMVDGGPVAFCLGTSRRWRSVIAVTLVHLSIEALFAIDSWWCRHGVDMRKCADEVAGPLPVDKSRWVLMCDVDRTGGRVRP